MRTIELPLPVKKATDALRERLHATVDAEPVGTANRYRLGVMSTQFSGMPHMRRQDLVWEIVDSVLDREESLMLTVILALSPEELSTSDPAAL